MIGNHHEFLLLSHNKKTRHVPSNQLNSVACARQNSAEQIQNTVSAYL